MSSTTNGCAQFSKQLVQLQNCVFTVFHILQLCTYSPSSPATRICIYRVSKKSKTSHLLCCMLNCLELFPFKLTLILKSKVFLLPSSSLKMPANTTVMLSGNPWSQRSPMIYLHTVSELHLEFMGKSKHLHSFTPPIPADQLINRALTPAVYLPLNTLLIRLHPAFLHPGVSSS